MDLIELDVCEPVQGPLVDEVELFMLEMPQANCEVTHTFFDGMYVREVRMKKGTIAIGHYQNFEHCNVFLEGKVQLYNDDGSEGEILTAPMTFKGKPGRKMGKMLEDVVWQNVYPTEIRDVEMLEALLLTKSLGFIETQKNKYIESYVKNDTQRLDFQNVVKELGMDMNQVTAQVENTEDQIELPIGVYKIKIGISTIDGRGVIATSQIKAGENIGIARSGFFRTPIGRFANHSQEPNAEMKQVGENINLVALRDIDVDEEVTTDYRATVKRLRG